MFRYYALSALCIVYMADIPRERSFAAESPGIVNSSGFDESRWHTRGWTLQELIAPRNVVFMTWIWKVIGTRHQLADKLQTITGIPASVLRHEVDIADTSIAQRMSWASSRSTTREEDGAYCLFGIFGIHMPTLYGEGRNAFYRLQEEIMRTSSDTSLFAWGNGFSVNGVLCLASALQRTHGSSSQGHLFATSPICFPKQRFVRALGPDNRRVSSLS